MELPSLAHLCTRQEKMLLAARAADARVQVCYPRPLHLDKSPSKDEETDRNLYECRYPEDERLSPYVPLWLLAWGANMNVQLMDHDRFLAYIAKYA